MLEIFQTSNPSVSAMNEPPIAISLTVERSPLPAEEEMRESYLRQYRHAAEKGEISFVKYWRLVRELDRAAVATLAGVTATVIEEAEKAGGPARLSRELLVRIARALNVSVELLA